MPRGRPEFSPTDDQRQEVALLTASGWTVAQIAPRIGISEPTLRKHFREEIDQALLLMNAAVAEKTLRNALSDGPGAGADRRLWLRCKAGWRENMPLAPPPMQEPKAKPLGKKEQALLDAQLLPAGRFGELMQRRRMLQ